MVSSYSSRRKLTWGSERWVVVWLWGTELCLNLLPRARVCLQGLGRELAAGREGAQETELRRGGAVMQEKRWEWVPRVCHSS